MSLREALESVDSLRCGFDVIGSLKNQLDKVGPLLQASEVCAELAETARLASELRMTEVDEAYRHIREMQDRLSPLVHEYALPGGITWLSTLTMPSDILPVNSEERQADFYRDDFSRTVREIEDGLQANEELVIFCNVGLEKFRVLKITMNSHNFLRLECSGCEEGSTVFLSGHINTLTLQFVVLPIVPPQVRRPIGFHMSSGE